MVNRYASRTSELPGNKVADKNAEPNSPQRPITSSFMIHRQFLSSLTGARGCFIISVFKGTDTNTTYIIINCTTYLTYRQGKKKAT